MKSRAALLALAAALAGFSPFQAEEEHVRAGNDRFRAGDPAAARARYDEAERAVGRRPEIDLDRGNAAVREGHLGEARESYRRAAATAGPALASRALQNLGNVLALEGDRDGAARAFADALSRDPSNDDARWNLEVLLRQASDGKGAPREPKAADRRDGERQRNRGDEGATRTEPAARPGEREERATPQRRNGEPLARQDAEALLDALRARERNMPLLGRERTKARRADAAKDW